MGTDGTWSDTGIHDTFDTGLYYRTDDLDVVVSSVLTVWNADHTFSYTRSFVIGRASASCVYADHRRG